MPFSIRRATNLIERHGMHSCFLGNRVVQGLSGHRTCRGQIPDKPQPPKPRMPSRLPQPSWPFSR
jgi:hypothetical protein